MNWELLWLFIVLNVLNVVIQTVKSIATIKCGKWSAALINAVAYGLYTYIVVLTMCDLPLIAKCLVVACANFVGVYVVKLCEEKIRKDRLWEIKFTINNQCFNMVETELKEAKISNYYIEIGKHTVFHCYSANQYESTIIKQIITKYQGRYFVSETKIL